MESMLLLDEPYADAICLQGYKEGSLILNLGTEWQNQLKGTNAVYTFKSYSSTPIKYSNSQTIASITQTTLEMALLYDKVLLPFQERFWRTGSNNESLDFICSVGPSKREQSEPEEIYYGPAYGAKIETDIKAGKLQEFGYLILERMDIMTRAKYPDLSIGLIAKAADYILEMINIKQRDWSHIVRKFGYWSSTYNEGYRDITDSLSPYFWTEYMGFKEAPKETWKRIIPSMLFVAGRLFDELYWAEMRNCPLLTYALRSSPNNNLSDITRNLQNTNNARVAVCLFFNNCLVVPKLHTIEDVIRLRKDPCIKDWRAKIMSWVDKFQEGELVLEEISERDFDDANKTIKRLQKVRIAKTIVVAISLPVAVLSTALSIPMGIITASAATCLFLYERNDKKKINWMMLGR